MKMTKIKYSIGESESIYDLSAFSKKVSDKKWIDNVDFITKADNNIIEGYDLNLNFLPIDIKLKNILKDSKPILIFEINRSTPQWKVERVLLIESIHEPLPNRSSFAYNLTFTKDSVNLIYTNIPKLTKYIEANGIDIDKFKLTAESYGQPAVKPKQNFYSYPIKDEIEKTLNEDGFIVLNNALYFMKVTDELMYVNTRYGCGDGKINIQSLYKNLYICRESCHTILIDNDVKEKHPEGFI